MNTLTMTHTCTLNMNIPPPSPFSHSYCGSLDQSLIATDSQLPVEYFYIQEQHGDQL